MLRINVEGIVRNVFIADGHVYFEDARGLIVNHPANRYDVGTDSYESSEMFLFNEEYLNLNNEDELEAFMDYCINQYKNDIYSFLFKGLSITLDYMDDPVAEDEDVLMIKLKEYCIK